LLWYGSGIHLEKEGRKGEKERERRAYSVDERFRLRRGGEWKALVEDGRSDLSKDGVREAKLQERSSLAERDDIAQQLGREGRLLGWRLLCFHCTFYGIYGGVFGDADVLLGMVDDGRDGRGGIGRRWGKVGLVGGRNVLARGYDGLLSQLCADAGRWKSTYRAWVILMSILSREEKLVVRRKLAQLLLPS
jgi:hypothetical protein